jgi:hypothetical protein
MGSENRDDTDIRLTGTELVLMAGALTLIGVLILMVASAL